MKEHVQGRWKGSDEVGEGQESEQNLCRGRLVSQPAENGEARLLQPPPCASLPLHQVSAWRPRGQWK